MSVICQSCTLKINGNQCKLTCLLCKMAYHAACCNISNADAQYMSEQNTVWKCSRCLDSSRRGPDKPITAPAERDSNQPLTIAHFNQLMAAIGVLQDDNRNTVAKFDELRNSIDSVCERLEQTKSALEASLAAAQSDIESLKAENALLDTRLKSLGNDPARADNFADVVMEVSDQQRRQNNLMIFNLPESPSGNVDEDSVKELLVILNRGQSVSFAGVNIRRLGRSKNSGGLPRPIRVVLPAAELVGRLLKNARVLRSSDGYRRVSVSRDRTPHQLSLYRSARAALQSRIDGGETNLKIKYVRNMPVVVSADEVPSSRTQDF